MLQFPPEKRLRLLHAERKELAALEELGVFEDVKPIPQDTKPIIWRFVYTEKDDVSQKGAQMNGERY